MHNTTGWKKGVGIVSELCAVFSHQTPVVAGDSEL